MYELLIFLKTIIYILEKFLTRYKWPTLIQENIQRGLQSQEKKIKFPKYLTLSKNAQIVL